MNTKSRFALIALVITILVASAATTALAGETFNLFTGNNSFDTMNEHGFYFITPWWTLNNKSGDKLDCYGKTLDAFNGDCSFKFKGKAGEKAALKQKIVGADLDTLNGFADDANVQLQMAYQINSLSDATNLKAKTVIKLSNGDKLKSLANFSGTTMIGEFTSWEPVNGTLVMMPQDAVAEQVTVSFKNKSVSGKALIDNVEVLFTSMAE